MITSLLLCLRLAAAAPAPVRILLDPGHGGRDLGATHGGARESEITLDVARRLAALMKGDRRFAVELTRTSDRAVSLVERARLARDTKANVFLSIHANSSPDAHAHGAEFYFQNQLVADAESAYLAHRENQFEKDEADGSKAARREVFADLDREVATIVGDLLDGDRVLESSRLSKALKRGWSGPHKARTDRVRQAPFFVLSRIDVPSALVELGFLTNDTDHARLGSSEGRAAMARDLYRGLQRYVESATNGNATR